MLSNPQHALPIPPPPHRERYKKLAMELAGESLQMRPARWLEPWATKGIETLALFQGETLTSQLPVRVDRWWMNLRNSCGESSEIPAREPMKGENRFEKPHNLANEAKLVPCHAIDLGGHRTYDSQRTGF
jgi:hypothetical protein